MFSNLSIQSFVLNHGERYCLLVDSDSGIPSFYPNLYVTTQVRNRSHSFSTMEAALGAVSVLFKFLTENKINLLQRFKAGKFLLTGEVDNLADFCQKNFRISSVSKVVAIKKSLKSKAVSSSTTYARLTYISDYLNWFAIYVNERTLTKEKRMAIEAMTGMIKVRRPQKKGKNLAMIEKGLTDNEVEVLFEIFRPESDLNPFTGQATKVRNRLIFLILYHLGIRSGELLNIKVRDIDFGSNQIVIARRADEKDDPRVDQPLVKTQDRRIPITDVLSQELHNYIMNFRRKVPNARKNEYLLVVHKSGPTQGSPISKSTYNKIIGIVRGVSPTLCNFTGHGLRHKWNERFSELMDTMDNIQDEAKQEQMRSWLMGWKQGSGTSSTYNQRFIQRKANEAAIELQNAGIRVPASILDDEDDLPW